MARHESLTTPVPAARTTQILRARTPRPWLGRQPVEDVARVSAMKKLILLAVLVVLGAVAAKKLRAE
jgi:hypothetical protein